VPKKPIISDVDLGEFEGQEKILVAKYLDADLLDKDSADSKNARNYLGIGMPEVRAIHKRMKLSQHTKAGVKTLREYMHWYRTACKMIGSYGAHVDL